MVTGTLELGPRSSVALDVTCWNAVIGSQSKIKGPLVAHGDVTILDHAIVHSIKAGGKVILRRVSRLEMLRAMIPSSSTAGSKAGN